MPSLNAATTAMDVDISNRSSQINSMLLRAWRERWTDAQWGTNIKAILPKGACGDSCNLAENILQQAVVGSDANKLVLSYLRHSLYSQQISHAAVIKKICKFDGFERPYCLIALLDFLESIIHGITCRSRAEEIHLPGSMLTMVNWLLQVYSSIVDGYFVNDSQQIQYQQMLNILTKLVDKINVNKYIIANLYLAKRENADFFKKIQKKLADVKIVLNNKKYCTLAQVKSIEESFNELILIKINGSLLENDSSDLLNDECESITYCLQPFVAVNVLLNQYGSVKSYVTHLQMIQHLKNYSNSRMYSELIRAALISLHNVSRDSEASRESMWFAFTFIKVPYILKQMNAINDPQQTEYSPEVVAALEMLIDDPMLDSLDTTCSCNTIEYLLNELANHNLITAQHVQQFASRRDPILMTLSKMDLNQQPSSIIKNLKKAEAPLSGILVTLDNDYNKMQEPLLGMLCELLPGNNFELILSVATMEGKLKTFVSRLIRWNENSEQIPSETDKAAAMRSALFDVSFLILTHIVQVYGSDVVLDEGGDSFFEKWIRDFMLEKNKNKSAMNMVHQCDQSKVDEFLLSISPIDTNASASTPKSSTLKWNEICLILPGVLYHLLVAWEHDTISAAEVKVHLDNIKTRMCSYSVCAAAWLCSYMQTVRDEELLKPLNMVQQFLAPCAVTDEIKQVNNFKERLNLTNQIIRKMQTDAQQNQKNRSPMLNIVSNQPLEEQFHDAWKTISVRGWLSVKATQILDNLLQSCGPYWMVSKMVNEILYCKFAKDMSKSMDIVFAIMHLNIEKCTITLLSDLLPMILLNKTQKFELIEPQLSVLARLCVYCIISTLGVNSNKLKSTLTSNDDGERPAKIRKLETTPFDILANGQPDKPSNAPNNGDNNTKTTVQSTKMREPLRICLRDLLQTLYQLTFTNELTPKILFVHQFLSYLHRCDRNRISPVLNLIPTGLMKNLLKVLSTNEFSFDYILRMYDLNSESGRRCAASDLLLFQSVETKNINSINF